MACGPAGGRTRAGLAGRGQCGESQQAWPHLGLRTWATQQFLSGSPLQVHQKARPGGRHPGRPHVLRLAGRGKRTRSSVGQRQASGVTLEPPARLHGGPPGRPGSLAQLPTVAEAPDTLVRKVPSHSPTSLLNPRSMLSSVALAHQPWRSSRDQREPQSCIQVKFSTRSVSSKLTYTSESLYAYEE